MNARSEASGSFQPQSLKTGCKQELEGKEAGTLETKEEPVDSPGTKEQAQQEARDQKKSLRLKRKRSNTSGGDGTGTTRDGHPGRVLHGMDNGNSSFSLTGLANPK